MEDIMAASSTIPRGFSLIGVIEDDPADAELVKFQIEETAQMIGKQRQVCRIHSGLSSD